MESGFNSAAQMPILAEEDRLVITSDWQGTLADMTDTNFPLLQFFSDAKRAGHRVIITSSGNMESIADLLELVSMFGKRQGYDITNQFELIGKQELRGMSLTADYSFDDEPIKDQYIEHYVDAATEVRVHRGFTTTPFSLEQLRTLCGLPCDKKGGEPSVPTSEPA